MMDKNDVAGIDPREYSSGRSVHKKTRISKAGNRHWRRALYMPALVAVRYDPHLRAFYHHPLEKGKEKLQALVAVMRKLLHAIFGMFKHHQPYAASQLVALPAEPCIAEVASTPKKKRFLRHPPKEKTCNARENLPRILPVVVCVFPSPCRHSQAPLESAQAHSSTPTLLGTLSPRTAKGF